MRRVADVSDSDQKRVAGVDVLEDTTGDDPSILRPEREAGSKRRGDEDYKDRGDAEIEEGVFVLNAAALIFVAHFGE